MRVFLFLAVLLFSALAAMASPTKGQLIGHWRFSDGHITGNYTFSKNGIFTGNVFEEGKLLGEFFGTWDLEGDTIVYKFEGSSFEPLPTGATDADKLEEATADYFIIQASHHKYVRVK